MIQPESAIETTRRIIDAAKERAKVRDEEPIHINIGAVDIPVKRSRPRNERDTSEIDPSTVHVMSDAERMYVPALIARLIELRAEKRKLNSEEDAIKDVLLAHAGELDYIAVAEGERPLVSLKHEERTTINTAWVHEHLPVQEHPEAYRVSETRPLRIMD